MTDLCAPFTLICHNGKHYIVRDGCQRRVAPPEVVVLWEQRPEALITLCELDGLTVWGIEGDGWQNDPDLLRAAAEALKARAGAIEKKAA